MAASVGLAIGLWTAVYMLASLTWRVSTELESATALAELAPLPQTTIVYDRHGQPAFTFFVEQRTDVSLDRVSPRMVEALLAIEDQRFFKHRGLDPVRIAGAALRNFRSGRIREGGSTLTQQLARTAQLTTRHRTFERKIREAMVAAHLEQRYSKREILQAYLNTVYFGEGYYGVEAASRGYFGKPAADLEAAEAALLAAVVRSPSVDAPRVSPERARNRRNLVLRLMRDQGRLADAEYQSALAVPLPAPSSRGDRTSAAQSRGGVGLYFEEELRRQLVAQFGSDRVLRGGLRVYSTYDPKLQQAAEEAVTSRVAALGKRSRSAADLQGALVSMDPSTGDVFALVGGRDFAASSFNRATQARRQAGSAFKPIVFAAALERGYGPGTVLSGLDAVIGQGEDAWLPGGEHEEEEFTIRGALKVSSNRAAAQLLQQIGTSTTLYYAQRLGITSSLPPVPSLALGTGEVTLLELTAAYTAFANRGISSGPRLFTRVEDANGVAIHHRAERHTPAISEATAYLMSSMLQDVVDRGTATGVRAAGFKLPAAGKTGTSDDYADAWFVGYTPTLVTGVWFGLDKPAPIMARGFAGVVAVPAWAKFMREATSGQRAAWYTMPKSVERVTICRRTGARATDACRHDYAVPVAVGTAGLTEVAYTPAAAQHSSQPPVYEEIFATGSLSSELCPFHSGVSGAIGTAEQGTTPAVATPLVDAAMQAAPLRRVVLANGTVRFVRQ